MLNSSQVHITELLAALMPPAPGKLGESAKGASPISGRRPAGDIQTSHNVEHLYCPKRFCSIWKVTVSNLIRIHHIFYSDYLEQQLEQSTWSWPDNLQPDPNKPIPGNWGVNCRDEYAIKNKLCFNELYRKLMQERCAATCPKDDCYDDRHDLCVAWAGNNFCTREMYTNMKTLCRKTCSMCTATTGF
ncbi:hypothetical protein Ddc_11656 [Ditylenchus destructor]|nr:hypothetical protein Ddc_11656 [Ditylenchus destructor]